jgi:aminoglycoside 3-N-acetyltransferase
VIAGVDRARLRADLETLPVQPGATVLVHASMRAVKPHQGSAATVVAALLDVLGPDGTLVVPTQTAWNSTSSPHFRAATEGMSPRQIAAHRAALPAFDPLTSPAHGMGALAEYVRTMTGAQRSAHPQTSFAAVGERAGELTRVHRINCHLGAESPLGALYESAGMVLHLGTGYGVSTIFHLAEYLYCALPLRTYECRLADSAGGDGDGWIRFTDIPLYDGDFARLGRDFEAATGGVRRGPVGSAEALIFPAQDAVRYAVKWMRRTRPEPGH